MELVKIPFGRASSDIAHTVLLWSINPDIWCQFGTLSTPFCFKNHPHFHFSIDIPFSCFLFLFHFNGSTSQTLHDPVRFDIQALYALEGKMLLLLLYTAVFLCRLFKESFEHFFFFIC